MLVPECGEGEWKRIASLTCMNDSVQNCPLAWREININGTRGCGRSSSQVESCSDTFFSPSSLRPIYQNVCGRVIDWLRIQEYQMPFLAGGHGIIGLLINLMSME